jgi:hypothetical protein
MPIRLHALVAACCLLLLGLPVRAQESLHPEELADTPRLILTLGAATDWDTSGGAAHFAPAVAVETTPIEHWLELELEFTPFVTRDATRWDTDFLFKKPWSLTSKTEFMIGVGPSWSHLAQNGIAGDTFSAELAADLMTRPTRSHRFGWYLEPGYKYAFAPDHAKSLGMSAGLLIGLARRHE